MLEVPFRIKDFVLKTTGQIKDIREIEQFDTPVEQFRAQIWNISSPTGRKFVI